MDETGYASIDHTVEVVGSTIKQLHVENTTETHLHFYVNCETFATQKEYFEPASSDRPVLPRTHIRSEIRSPPHSPLTKGITMPTNAAYEDHPPTPPPRTTSLANPQPFPGWKSSMQNSVVKNFLEQSRGLQLTPCVPTKQVPPKRCIPVRQASSPVMTPLRPGGRTNFPSEFQRSHKSYLTPQLLAGRPFSSERLKNVKSAKGTSNISRSSNLTVPTTRTTTQAEDESYRAKGSLVLFDKSIKCFRAWDIFEDKWSKYSDIPEGLGTSSFTTIALENSIYILTNDRKTFRLNNQIWERMSNMKFDHGVKPPAVAIDGHIFVAGSFGSCGSKDAEYFNPLNNKWFKKAAMPQKKADHALVASDGAIYCIGGKAKRSVEKFGLLPGTWTSVSPMNTARKCFAAAAFGKTIYAIGGEQSGKNSQSFMNSVEVYEIDADTWTIVEPIQIPRSRFSACVIRDNLFLIGGDSESYHEDVKTIESLSMTAAKKQWTLKALPHDVNIDAMSAIVLFKWQ